MDRSTLIVKRSGIVNRQLVKEGIRGTTFVAENSLLPFTLARFYIIYDVSDFNIERGGHAHKRNEQALFVLKGSCEIMLDDGEGRQTVRLTDTEPGIRLGSGLWHTMSSFSKDCILAVAASENYDRGDYITDYNEFLEYARSIQ
ncbi:FdtA/QdtA family cupin domain-containing protein [Candidatus Kaiserbacteria bacterium]|nr:FdtA/QdtA family cupin domain-containing protein [Candidatus Kaiserbacteria bacterium]